MTTYDMTQRADDFKPGTRIRVRSAEESTWVAGNDVLKPGEVYTVDRVEVVNEHRGSGQIHLVERSDGGFGGAFGHLLFDPTPVVDFKAGDRVMVIEATYVSGLPAPGTLLETDVPRHMLPDHPYRVKLDDDSINGTEPIVAKVIERLEDDATEAEDDSAAFKVGDRVEVVGWGTGTADSAWNGPAVVTEVRWGNFIVVQTDGPMGKGAFKPEYIRLVEAAPVATEDDGPDLSDADVRKGLPTMEAYPVGSVWNHIASGDEPVTITGPDPDNENRVMVHVPKYLRQTPHRGSWARGSLDTYGTLVSLPGDPRLTMAGLEALQAAERDKALEESVKTVEALRAEITDLKQAAADERRRLCAEIDMFKADRDAAVATRDQIAAERAEARADVNDLKDRLAASEKRSDEGWALAAKDAALLDFVRLNFLSDSDIDKVDGFGLGWDARNKD